MGFLTNIAIKNTTKIWTTKICLQIEEGMFNDPQTNPIEILKEIITSKNQCDTNFPIDFMNAINSMNFHESFLIIILYAVRLELDDSTIGSNKDYALIDKTIMSTINSLAKSNSILGLFVRRKIVQEMSTDRYCTNA
jgi:hypothetical protein